jgi:PAS domain S-box-containing protein
MFILAAIAIPFVAGGRVPGFSPTSSVLDEVIVMQLVLVCAAVPSLFLAAVVTERADSEAARLANERRHGVTLQSIGDAVITTDNHGLVELANPVAESLTGWRNAEARGKPLPDVFHIVNERTRQTVESPVERVLRDGRVVGLANHTLLVARDGTERPIADSGAPIRDEDGTITGVVLVFRDQTEELAATESLRRSQALLESVTEGTTDCVFVKDRTGRYVLCNSAACQLVGKPREVILGSDDTALFPPDDARVVMDLDQQVMASGKTTTTDEVLRMGAEPRTFLSTKGPICNAQGEVVGMFGISRDVTERRKAEEALRISEERYRAILHTAMDGFFLLDLQGRLLEVNETYCKMSGYSQAELLTMSVPDLSAAETAAQTKAHLERIVARGADRFESRHRRKDGTTYEVAASVQYSPIEGGRIVVFLQDISARKAAEREKEALEAQLRQSQRLESVGLLAGGIAHDFNNMLGVILGSAERAIEQAATAQPVAEELAEIRNAALHSAALTRQLLTFARRQTVSPKVMDLNETVPEMITMLQRLIGEDVLLLWQPAERLWPIKMDPSQLDQVLTNLCLNARHAMASVGTILIATENRVIDAEFCSTHADALPGEYVRLTVRDTGVGMDAATVRRIFEPFFTTKGVGKGTGLGLSSVYGAVRQCGGFLTVDSVVGVGTTFEMYLPRDAAQKPSADHKSDRTPADVQGHETILLVEDEPALLRLTRRILESQGYTVIATGRPDEGIQLAREHGGEIDLLLSDVIMPEMNGYEMAATLRAARPRLTCLFMSGYSADTVTEHGMPADAPLIEKPFTPAALVAKVRAVLDAASA